MAIKAVKEVKAKTEMKNYKKFMATWETLLQTSKEFEQTEPYSMRHKGSVVFVHGIWESISKSKIFELDDDIKNLLLLTDAPDEVDDDELMLPFPDMFIECSITEADIKKFCPKAKSYAIFGILIRKGKLLTRTPLNPITDGIGVGEGLRITVCHEKKHRGEAYRNLTTYNTQTNESDMDFSYSYSELDEREPVDTMLDKSSKSFVTDFVRCLLHFLTNPEVKLLEVHRGKKNKQRRLRQGKRPLPTSFKIRVDGYLKEYINELQSGGSFSYSHRFWVRGHFRTLKADRYKDNIGTRVWVRPYIKGEGVLINKKYEVESKHRGDGNEK
jgi:hypothetical protein